MSSTANFANPGAILDSVRRHLTQKERRQAAADLHKEATRLQSIAEELFAAAQNESDESAKRAVIRQAVEMMKASRLRFEDASKALEP